MHCENTFITGDIVLKKSSFQKIFFSKANQISSTEKATKASVQKWNVFSNKKINSLLQGFCKTFNRNVFYLLLHKEEPVFGLLK